MPDAPEALEVVLRKRKPLAPPFHRHIVKAKLRDTVCRVGDLVVVYEVAHTEPAGDVRVTDRTVLRFE